MICSGCGKENENDVRFCIECGKELKNLAKAEISDAVVNKKEICPRCGKEIAGDIKFCIECGYNLAGEVKQKTRPIYKAESASDAFKRLHRLSEKIREKPKMFQILLGVNFLICTIFFATLMEIPKALIASFTFTVLWGLIFIFVPSLLRLLLGILAIVAIVVLFFILLKLTNNVVFALIGTAVVVFILVVIIALIVYAAFLLPGLILGACAYKIFGEGTGGFIAGVTVFAIVSVVLYFILRYVVPFIVGYTWASFTGLLSYRITLSVIGGVTIARDMSDSYNNGFTYSSGMLSIKTLFNYLLSSIYPPKLFALWLIFISIALGIFIAKGAGEEE